jgi:hypothetical protein
LKFKIIGVALNKLTALGGFVKPIKSMSISKKEPMVLSSYQVHTTTDYFLFKPIEGNRNKNLLHLNRLKKSMSENYLFTVIIVNENYEIIDGQHRFEVIKEFGFPLHYIVCKGYGLNEVHILNQNTRNWNADDYLQAYCNLEYPDYLEYRKFKKKFGFGHNECIILLGGGSSGDIFKVFASGMFKIMNYEDAYEKASKISMVGAYYDGYGRRSFIHAMRRVLDKPEFNFTQFLQKLKAQPTALQNCSDVDQYILLIEEIYNYRSREKVNLRY